MTYDSLSIFLFNEFNDIGLEKKLGDMSIADINVLAKHINEFIINKTKEDELDEPPF